MIEQTQTAPRLVGTTVRRADLDATVQAAMLRLFQRFYDRVDPKLFARDLAAKDRVILLHDAATGALQGFSSLALAETTAAGQRISVVYSGDTIVHPDAWGTPELPSTWIKSVLSLTAGMAQPVYWLLISSGYKSYRFLPVFYREFYPCHDRPTPPALQALLDALALARFGAQYDRIRGVVRFAEGATPLRPGVADIDAGRLRNQHVRFFLERNPGYEQGDELVCLTHIHPDNFTAAGQRMAR